MNWQRVVLMLGMIGGGVGLIVLGQVPLGATLIGAAVGNAAPGSVFTKSAPAIIGQPKP